MSFLRSLILLTFCISLVSCASNVTKKLTNNHQPEWQQWVSNYDKSRRSSDGWLSLVGLYWLSDGDNSIGSANNNQHVFPIGTPENFGSININNDIVTFTRLSNEITIGGKNIEQKILELNETTIAYGSYSFYIIKRERGYAIRLKNTQNPAIAKYNGAHFYPYAESLRLPAKLVKHKKDTKIKIATVYQTIRNNDSAGMLEFEYQGKTFRLQAVSYGKDTPMAIMFADETSQDTTYGAGRFLDVEWPVNGDMTIIDFNEAYNPPCAITEFATCPLPPSQNRLKIKIEAGELFSGH